MAAADRTANPTRTSPPDFSRQLASRLVDGLWRDHHRALLSDAGLRRSDRDGRLEVTGPRAERFYGLRYDLSVALAAGAITADEARARVAASEFAADLRVAGAASEAVEHLAGLFADGNNAWTDAEHAGRVLWVTVRRD